MISFDLSSCDGPLRADQVQHLNLATNTGAIPLSEAMTEVFNNRFSTNVTRLVLNVFWHKSSGGPPLSSLKVERLSEGQLECLNMATSGGRREIDEAMASHFNALYSTEFEPQYLDDLFRLTSGGPGLRSPLPPSFTIPIYPAIPY
jgi:hypothetical protein